MKCVYIVRHAKSSWDDMSLDDKDRPLNTRGNRDAPAMAKMLAKQGGNLELFITSPAKRARATAKYFRSGLGIPKDLVTVNASLYHASAEQIQSVIRSLDLDVHTIAIFGHNPGMTDFVNQYSDGRIDNMPTCGIARIEFDVKEWHEAGEGRLVNFYYPKMYGLF